MPGFANLHPLQPEETAQGAMALIYNLQQMLRRLPGLLPSRFNRPPVRTAS